MPHTTNPKHKTENLGRLVIACRFYRAPSALFSTLNAFC
jgi:hypothetical protein